MDAIRVLQMPEARSSFSRARSPQREVIGMGGGLLCLAVQSEQGAEQKGGVAVVGSAELLSAVVRLVGVGPALISRDPVRVGCLSPALARAGACALR